MKRAIKGIFLLLQTDNGFLVKLNTINHYIYIIYCLLFQHKLEFYPAFFCLFSTKMKEKQSKTESLVHQGLRFF